MTKEEKNIILGMCRETAISYYWAMDTKIGEILKLKGKYYQALRTAIALGIEIPDDLDDLHIEISKKEIKKFEEISRIFDYSVEYIQ